MINFALTTFNRLILHRIEKKERGEEHSRVVFEDQLVESGDEVRRIIKQRINDACGRQSKSFKLYIDKFGPSSFFGLSRDLHSLNDDQFIEKSRQIALLLGRSQRRAVNGGYLIVIEAVTREGKKIVIAIKAELQNAFTTKVNEETNKKQIEVLNDLFLAPSNKFFKIGFIYEENSVDEEFPNNEWGCVIFDDQFSTRKAPADYFVSDFLGFSLDKNSKIMNREFYLKTKSVITENQEATIEEKRDALKALNVVFKDQEEQIDPVEFGERFLPSSIQPEYSEQILSDERFDRPFKKDTELMKNELSKKIMFFNNKVRIQGPEELFDDTVKIITTIEQAEESLENDNDTLLSIKGKPYISE